MAGNFDGNIRLGVSLETDAKSLSSELSSMTREIKKTFNGLGKSVSEIPSSFSNIKKSVDNVSVSLQKAMEPAEAFKQFMTSFTAETISATPVEELKEDMAMLASFIEDSYNKLGAMGSVDASNPTVLQLTRDMDTAQILLGRIGEYLRSISGEEETIDDLEERELQNARARVAVKQQESSETQKIAQAHKEEESTVNRLGSLYKAIAETQKDLKNYEKSGTGLLNDEEYVKAKKALEDMKQEAKEYLAELQKIQGTSLSPDNVGRTVSKKSSSSLGGLSDGIKRASSLLSLLGKHGNRAGLSIGKGFKRGLLNLTKLVFGVRTLFALFRRLRQVVIQAFSTLASQFPEINHQMSELKTSIQGLKASLGTALQPLFSALEPILNRIIQRLTTMIELVGKFFASITGQGYIYKATTAWQDYSASVKEANKQLFAFDELNVLDDKSADNGNLLSGVTYEKEPVDDRFKKMWDKADFTELGHDLAVKLRDTLNNIPWDDVIIPMARKLAKSIGTFVNGFVETEGIGESIGRTIAKAIDTGIAFVLTLGETLHFYSIGQFIANGIKSFFINLDVADLANAIFTWIHGAITALLAILGDDELWQVIGQKIAEFLLNINWSELILDVFAVIGGIIRALAITLWSMLEEIFKGGVEKIVPLIAIIAGGIGLAKLIGALKSTKQAAEIVQSPIISLSGAFSNFLNSLGQATVIASIGFMLMEVGNIIQSLTGLVQTMNDTNTSAWTVLGLLVGIIAALLIPLAALMLFVTPVQAATLLLIAAAIGIIGEAITKVLNAITDLVERPIRTLIEFLDVLKLDTEWMMTNVPVLTQLIRALLEQYKTAISTMKAKADELVNKFKSMTTTLTQQADIFKKGFEKMSKAVKDCASSIANTPIKPIINTSSIDAGISKLNTFLSLMSRAGSSSLRVSTPSYGFNIPHLASGGVLPANQPFLAMLGDQKSGTNIEAPLDTIKDAIREVLAETNFGNSNSNQPIKVYIRGKEVFDAVVAENNSTIMRTGTSPLVK